MSGVINIVNQAESLFNEYYGLCIIHLWLSWYRLVRICTAVVF